MSFRARGHAEVLVTTVVCHAQELELGVVDYLLGFPDGELGFGPKKVFTAQLPLFAVVHLFWEPILPAVLTVVTLVSLPLMILKFNLPRTRPTGKRAPPRLVDVRAKAYLDNDSFPSGCSAMVAAVMYVLWQLTGSAWWLGVIPLAMFTRIYFHCHWFFDTVCGTIMGWGIARGVQALVDDGEFRRIQFGSPIFLFSVGCVLPPMIFLLKKNEREG